MNVNLISTVIVPSATPTNRQCQLTVLSATIGIVQTSSFLPREWVWHTFYLSSWFVLPWEVMLLKSLPTFIGCACLLFRELPIHAFCLLFHRVVCSPLSFGHYGSVMSWHPREACSWSPGLHSPVGTKSWDSPSSFISFGLIHPWKEGCPPIPQAGNEVEADQSNVAVLQQEWDW